MTTEELLTLAPSTQVASIKYGDIFVRVLDDSNIKELKGVFLHLKTGKLIHASYLENVVSRIQ